MERVWLVPNHLDELTALPQEALLIDQHLGEPNLTNKRRGDKIHRDLSWKEDWTRRVKVGWAHTVEAVPSKQTMEITTKWFFRIVDFIES